MSFITQIKNIDLQLDSNIIDTFKSIIEPYKYIKHTATIETTINNVTKQTTKQLCIRFYITSENDILFNIIEFTFHKSSRYLYLFELSEVFNNSNIDIHDYDIQTITDEIMYYINDGLHYKFLSNYFN